MVVKGLRGDLGGTAISALGVALFLWNALNLRERNAKGS
jgi:hypothetical protein